MMKNKCFWVLIFMLCAPNFSWAKGAPLVICKEQPFELEDIDSGRLPPSDKGSKHYLKVPSKATKADLEEKERKSRISEDLATLGEVAGKLKDAAGIVSGVAAEPKECIEYIQGYKRATLEIKTLDDGDNEISKHTLVAGPAEHLYLSADMPVTDIKQLTYDSGSNSVVEKEKPASFYLGLNFKIGDVFTNYPVSQFYNDLSIKALFKASSKPSESMGVGLGYSFKALEVFVAQVWTKDDQSAGGTDLGTTDSTIYGVSFNLTKGLNWLKNDK